VPIAHSHDAYEETIYGIEGVITFTLEGRKIEIGPGDALCIPRYPTGSGPPLRQPSLRYIKDARHPQPRHPHPVFGLDLGFFGDDTRANSPTAENGPGMSLDPREKFSPENIASPEDAILWGFSRVFRVSKAENNHVWTVWRRMGDSNPR